MTPSALRIGFQITLKSDLDLSKFSMKLLSFLNENGGLAAFTISEQQVGLDTSWVEPKKVDSAWLEFLAAANLRAGGVQKLYDLNIRDFDSLCAANVHILSERPLWLNGRDLNLFRKLLQRYNGRVLSDERWVREQNPDVPLLQDVLEPLCGRVRKGISRLEIESTHVLLLQSDFDFLDTKNFGQESLRLLNDRLAELKLKRFPPSQGD